MKTCLAISASLGLGIVRLFAITTFIVEGGPNGQNPANYFDTGWGASSGKVFAPGCTSTGTRYSGTGTYFGPSRYAEASYTPTAAGYYEVDLTWTSTAGQSHTAVNLYTGSATGGPDDLWGNPGGPQGIITSGTVYQYYSNARSWWQFTTALLDAGTTYHVGVYGGYKTPYAGGATPADTQANRVTLGGVRFTTATPLQVNYNMLDHAVDLGTVSGDHVTGVELIWGASWAQNFDVWLGTSPGSLTKIVTGHDSQILYLDDQNLQQGTQYFYRVDAVNMDVTTPGEVWDFTTVQIPEPSTTLLSLLGGLTLIGFRHRPSILRAFWARASS